MAVCTKQVEVEAGTIQAETTGPGKGVGKGRGEAVVEVEVEENEAGGARKGEDLSHLLARKGRKPQPRARSATHTRDH